MACSTKPGVAHFLNYIEETTGERVSQRDWHDIRTLAKEGGDTMGRNRVTPDDARTVFSCLADAIDEEMSAELPRDSFESFEAQSKRNYGRMLAEDDFPSSQVTDGTAAAIEYLTANGVRDTLAKVRAARNAKEVKQTDC